MTIINDIKIKDHYVYNLPENGELSSFARKNRKAGNLAEVIFWMQVHQKMFYGLDFDRQKIIGNYIVDFYVKRLGLVVEIDGGSHNEKNGIRFPERSIFGKPRAESVPHHGL